MAFSQLKLIPSLSLLAFASAALLIVIQQPLSASAGPDTKRLPPIWNQGTLDDEDESYGTYRILSEIHLDDKSSFIVEEWLDGPHKNFRMDVLPEHDQGDSRAGAKKSFLVNGGSQERFFFEPFRCMNLNENSLDKNLQLAGLTNLFEVFPSHALQQNSQVFGGLGSIWQDALDSHVEPSFRAAKTQMPIAGRRRARSKFEVLRTLNKFTIEANHGFPFRTEFYFTSPAQTDPTAGSAEDEISAKNLVAMQLIDPNLAKTKLTARIIELDVGLSSMPISSLGSEAKGLFELPLGYGCSRRMPSEKIDYKPPRNCFNSNQPHTCYLEVATWLPSDLDDRDIDYWRHHTTSMRIVSGNLIGRSYMTVEETDFAPIGDEPELNLDTLDYDEDSTTTTTAPYKRGVAMRRAKRVWDLGRVPDSKQSSSNAGAPPSTPKSMYFGLVDHVRSCANVMNAELGAIPNIEFTLILPDEEKGKEKEKSPNESPEVKPSKPLGEQRSTTRQVGLTLIDSQMSSEFFEQLDGYKLVRKTSGTWLKYQTIHQEKRVDKFEFRDSSGRVAWVGPVSLIRKFNYIDTIGSDVKSIEDTKDTSHTSQLGIPVEALRVELTIIPYTARLDRQLGRIHLIMSPGLLVDEAYLHREINIGPCLRPSSLSLYDGDVKRNSHWDVGHQDWPSTLSESSLDFKLIYPLEEPIPVKQIASARSQIYALFLRHLCGDALLQPVNGRALNPLQVTHLRVDIEPELVQIKGSLNKWPETFNYIKRAGTRPVTSSRLKVFLREPKPDDELCAQSCSHYNCPVFVYDRVSKLCELYEWTFSARKQHDQEEFGFLGDYLSASFERKGETPPSADPKLVLARMRQLIKEEEGNDDRTNDLTLELDWGLILAPSLLQIGDELWQQDQLLLGSGDGAASSSENRRLQLSDSSVEDGVYRRSKLKVSIEFAYFAKNQKFSQEHSLDESSFPLAEAKHVSRQECEQLCLEHDCRSYSYCSMESSCIISKLTSADALKAACEPEDFCAVMVIDHLSKFQATSKGLALRETLISSGQDSSISSLFLKFESQRNCAEACLESKEINCRSFFFCRPDDGKEISGDCFLYANRQSILLINAKTNASKSPPDEISPATGGHGCDYYQRSYLADYHQHHGRRLSNVDSKQGKNIEILIGLGSEDCASECSRLALDDGEQQASTCRAFHVCFGDEGGSKKATGRGKRKQLLCGLLTEEPRRILPADTTMKTEGFISDAPKCTTFVRIDGDTIGPPSSDQAQVLSDHSSLKTETDSHAGRHISFWQSVVIVSIGLGIGYWTGWLIAWRAGNGVN